MPALSHQRGQSRALKARMTSLVLPGPTAGRRLASGPMCAEGGGIVCVLVVLDKNLHSHLEEEEGMVQPVSNSLIDTCARGGMTVIAFVERCAR